MPNVTYDIDEITGEYTGKDGTVKTWFEDGVALGILLINDVVFLNQHKYLEIDGTTENSTTVILVLCNDVFMWGCADGENLLNEEIGPLFMMWHDNNQWGPLKWVCIKRQEKPQGPIVRDMKLGGVWDEIMEALPDNHADKHNRSKESQ